jgi:uncharacterized membrane protein
VTSRHAETPSPSRAAYVVALLAAIIGLTASVYLTAEHYNHAKSFACPETAAINCLKVTTSSWSVIAGIPVAVLGLAYFAVMTVLVAYPGQRREVQYLRLVGGTTGVAAAVYLIYLELFRINAICLWCTTVHLSALILFAATLWRDTGNAVTSQPPHRRDR